MEKPKLTTLNVKPETKEAFQALKRQLQADLNQTMTDDEALSFLFSKLTEKREPVKEQKPATPSRLATSLLCRELTCGLVPISIIPA